MARRRRPGARHGRRGLVDERRPTVSARSQHWSVLNHFRSRSARLAALAIAALALARLFIHWPRIWDVGLWDESFYLGEGLNNAPYLMSQYEAFPLYSKFYHVLAVVFGNGDVPRLYMVGGLLVILLGLFGVGLGVWAASRSLGVTIASMAIVALTGALIWPRVVFLNLFILGVGFAAAALAADRFTKLSLVA